MYDQDEQGYESFVPQLILLGNIKGRFEYPELRRLEHQHALKEVDAAALAVTKSVDEVVNILKYTIKGKI